MSVARPGAVLSAILVIPLVAGCGSGGPGNGTPTERPSPTVAASPTPAPTATQTPTELAVDAAIKMFTAGDLRARITIEQEVTASGRVFGATGALDIEGPNEHETWARSVDGEPTETSESISIEDSEWQRLDDGPWHEGDASDDTPLVAGFAELTSLEVVGLEEIGGSQVVHVRPGSSAVLEPANWGPDDEGMVDWEMDLDIWIGLDGRPLRLEMNATWNLQSGTDLIAFTASRDLVFEPLPDSVTISPPDDPWVTFRSTDGYSIAQPSGTTRSTTPEGDTYDRKGATSIVIAPAELEPGQTLDGFLDDFLALVVDSGIRVEGVEDVRVDSRAGAIVTLASDEPEPVRLVSAYFVDDGVLWALLMRSTPEQQEADRAHLEATLTTFDLE